VAVVVVVEVEAAGEVVVLAAEVVVRLALVWAPVSLPLLVRGLALAPLLLLARVLVWEWVRQMSFAASVSS
jgi:hypothetical protein